MVKTTSLLALIATYCIVACCISGIQATIVKRNGKNYKILKGFEFYLDGDKLHYDHKGKTKQVLSFIHKDTGEVIPHDSLIHELQTGIAKRDWSDIIENTFVAFTLKIAAAATGVGSAVVALDFAYNAIRNSVTLAAAYNAGSAAFSTFAYGVTTVLQSGVTGLLYGSVLSRRNCENDGVEGYTYVDTKGDDCAYWIYPKDNYPNDDVMSTFSNDFAGHLSSSSEDRVNAGLDNGSAPSGDYNLESVVEAGVHCNNQNQQESDEC